MENLKNLTEICVTRMDVLLQIYDGYVCVYMGEGPNRRNMVAKCNDDKKIGEFILLLQSTPEKLTCNKAA